MPDGLIPDPSRPGKYIRVQAPMRIGKPVTQSNTAWTTGAPWAYSVSSNAANLAASALNRLAPGWNPTVYSAGYMGGNPWRGYTTPPAPQQPRPPTPVTQTPAPPYAYTPPPAWISSLYPNTAPQAAEPTPTATPLAPTYAPQQSKDWYKNLFLYRKDGTPTAYSGGPVDYGMSWENVDRYLETGDPGALNRFGQPVGTPAPLSYSGFSGRARGGQPRKRTPELEAKLQWAHQTLNDLRRGKKPQKQQSSGRTAPAWVGGIGSFNV